MAEYSYSPELVNDLNKLARDYAPRAEIAIKQEIAKWSNTGAAVNSVKVEIVDGKSNQSPALKISFADHLLVFNTRHPEWVGQPNMYALTAWAQTKRSNPEEVKKLAFATAYNQKKFDTWKPKYWRKKSLSQLLKELNKKIITEYKVELENAIKRALIIK